MIHNFYRNCKFAENHQRVQRYNDPPLFSNRYIKRIRNKIKNVYSVSSSICTIHIVQLRDCLLVIKLKQVIQRLS